MFKSSKVPGPGTYKAQTERSPGKTILSTYKSSPTTVFSHPSFARFSVSKERALPGPGSYHIEEEFLKSGYNLSQFKYQGARKFPISARETMEKKDMETPGPGSYRLPSEFGYYESTKKKTLSMPNIKAGKKKN